MTDEKTPTPNLPPMFTPFILRGMTVANRVVMSPIFMYASTDGLISDFQIVHIGSRAMGGAGLVMTEMTDVEPEGRISPSCAGLWSEQHAEAWKRVVDFVHEQTDAKIGIQLAHAGRKGSLPRSWERGGDGLGSDGWQVIGPTDAPFSPTSPKPRAMTADDIAALTAKFVYSTKLAHAAGFDLIELHMGHGYLLSGFMSPLSNDRTDAYGGNREKRMRFPLEVLAAVRAAWPDDKPISCRISAIDWEDGGNTIEDGIGMSRMLYDGGCDIVDVSSGNVTAERRPQPKGLFQTPFSEQIRTAIGKPTMSVGNIRTAKDVNAIVADSRADLCAIAKGHLYDPYFVRHAAVELGVPLAWPKRYKPVEAMLKD
jgi:anthraniloyl-CoA monooxygenase